MRFFKKRKDAAPDTAADQALIDLFTQRAARLGLPASEADIREALRQARAQALQDDAIYQLPDRYGSRLLFGAQQGDAACQAFVGRALAGGAQPEDVQQWWDLPDLERRLYAWEHAVLLEDFYQQLQQKNLSESEVMMNMFRMLPFYGDPEDESVFSGENRPLPEEMRPWVFAWAEATTGDLHPASLREAAIPFPSMNAYLRAQRPPNPWEAPLQAVLHRYEQQQYGEALQAAEALHETMEAQLAEDDPVRSQLMQALMPVFMAGGRYDLNLPWLEKARAASDPQASAYPILCNNLGLHYTEMGRFQEAAGCFQAGIQALQGHPERALQEWLVVRIMHNLALVLARAGQYADAAPYYEKARQVLTGQTDALAQDLLELVQANLSLTYLGLGRVEEALTMQTEVLRQREARLGPDHPHVANSLDSLGNMWGQKGEVPQGMPLLERAATIRRARLGPKHPDYTLSLNNLAMAHAHLGQWEKAVSCITIAVHNVLDQIRQQYLFLPEAEQQAFFRLLTEVLDFCRSLTAAVYPQYPELLPLLFEIQVQSRGLQIRGLQQLKQQVAMTDDDQLQALFATWMEQKSRLAEVYALPDAEPQRLRGEQVVQDLEEKLRRQVPAFAEHLRTVPSWRDIQAALQEGEVLVECFSCYTLTSLLQGPVQRQYGALLLHPDSPAPVYVPFSPLDQPESHLLEAYHAWVQQDPSAQTRSLSWDEAPAPEASAAPLFQALWAPLQALLGSARQLYFLPDGLFYQVNAETLWDPAREGYVGERLSIRLLNHAADLLQPPSPPSPRPAVLMGDPAFGASGGIAPLPGTRTEVGQIEALLRQAGQPAEVYLGAGAQAAQLRQVRQPALLHLATHGFFEAEIRQGQSLAGFQQDAVEKHPYLRAGLLLAGDAPEGIFTAYEAANLNLLHTALVVLSACNTGSGDIQAGEGVYGLSRAFREAGAQAVMHSLWPVSDAVTAEFMGLFYRYWLAEGHLRPAFRQAQAAIKARHPEPYYWGAFQLV